MRKSNSLKNFFSVAFPYIIIALLGFLRVRLFLKFLGEDISSLNQLYNNLIAYLALAEGGVGLFVVQKYYQCFVDNDQKKITTIFNASNRYFKILALFIVGASIILSFFLKEVTNNGLSLLYMQVTFIIFSIRFAIEYYYFAPRFVIQADQKLYKINYLLNLIRITEMVAEIILLFFCDDYIVILIPGLLIRMVGYPLINRYIYKLYPFIKQKVKYSKETLKGFSHIVIQKIAGLVYDNTDVIIVSSFLSPLYVIVYTSYNYISKFLNDFATMLSSSIMASFGNVLYKESKEKSLEIFNQLNILFVFVGAFFSLCFAVLITSFVNLWVGSKYTLSSLSVLLFAIVLYINIIKKPINTLKDNLGLFKETKKIIIIETILNVIISLLLVKSFGINGILIGTILSSLFTTYWYLPVYLFKHFFRKSTALYFGSTMMGLILILSFLLIPKVISSNFIYWMLSAILFTIIILIIMFLIFYLLFKSFRNLIKLGFEMLRGTYEKNN